GPVAATGPRRRRGWGTTTAGHGLPTGRARGRTRPRTRPRGRARGLYGPRWAVDRRNAVATRGGDRQTWRHARPDDHLSARRPDMAGVSELPALQAPARAGGLRVPRRGLPWVDRIREGVPAREP